MHRTFVASPGSVNSKCFATNRGVGSEPSSIDTCAIFKRLCIPPRCGPVSVFRSIRGKEQACPSATLQELPSAENG